MVMVVEIAVAEKLEFKEIAIMDRRIWTTIFGILLIGGPCLSPGGVMAGYPEKAVTVIVPHPAGGETDQLARAITEAARKDFPKGIAVVNRAGGGATIGVAELVRAKPDGYTIACAPPAPLVVGPHRMDTPYKTANDYQPIIRMVKSAYTIAVLPDKPWKNLQELLEYARTNPGKVRIGIPGEGTIPHLAIVRLLRLAKVDMTVVPFVGTAESVTALLGGHIDANLSPFPDIIAHVQAGKARILVSLDDSRNSSFPDLQTAKEAGIDVTCILEFSIIGPKGLSPEIVSVLHGFFKQALDDPNFRKTMANRYFEIAYEGPEGLKKRLLQDYDMYGAVVEELNLGKK
jgi:tripartite-type tricarboxylate transporter receptor subunit TctC